MVISYDYALYQIMFVLKFVFSPHFFHACKKGEG